MELKQLRTFVQVVRSGSFSAAAARLHIVQPAISRQIQALEEELGVALLHRTGRGVLATIAGQALLHDAERLLAEADAVQRRVRGFGSALAGEATIGLSPTIGRVLTAALATRVRTAYPQLTLRIAEGFSGTLLEWLGEGRIDAAILYHCPANPAIHAEPVAEEALSLIGGAGDPAFPPGAEVTLAMLPGHPLVLSTPGHALRRLIDAAARAAGVSLDLLFEFDSLDATVALVRQRAALTILPEAPVRAELAAGTLVAWPIVGPRLARPLVVATAPQRAHAVSSRDIAQLLRDAIGASAGECGWTSL